MNTNTNENIIKNLNVCNNCGKQGHLFHQCKLPITSYGILAFTQINSSIKFLMIRRKDSFGYIDFIRGKYSLHNIYQIQNIIDEMSIMEKERILEEPFEKLWYNMWGEITSAQYKNEELLSVKKFDALREGILIDNKIVKLKDIVEKSETKWLETEWEFPKGRRNFKEKDLECALREFEEETGIPQSKIIVIENIMPFEEIFIGSNYKSYKHKYFLAYMNHVDQLLNNFQKSEVSKIEWKTYDECMSSIRPYNLEKKKLITNIYNVLQEYRLYL
jgi:8-oxo-dGTP pyrophosphatase MutT (NUDIX family)